MKDTGYVKLHRSMLEWGWYTDIPTRVLFDHLLLVVNWKPGVFLGQRVEPGSVVTSHGKLAEGSGLTEKQVRRALSNLESTGEITIGRAGRGQLVTLTGWAFYQSDDETGAASGQLQGRDRAETGQLQGNYQRREESKKGRNRESTPSASRSLTFKTWTVDDFKRECKAIVDNDPAILLPSERGAFFAYWTESSAYGLMRFQGEKFFDLRRRMATWQQRAAQTPTKRGNGTVIPINAESLPYEERKAIKQRIQGELRIKYGWQPGQPVQREWIEPQYLDIMGFSKSAS